MTLATESKSFHAHAVGHIVLEYKGKNIDNFGRVGHRPARLSWYFRDAKNSENSELFFNIDFQEFHGITMQMDFAKSIIRAHARGDDFLSDVGVVHLRRISCDRESFVVSGSYKHETISLAYHNDDMVHFHACFDTRQLGSRFHPLAVQEAFINYPHLIRVTRFEFLSDV